MPTSPPALNWGWQRKRREEYKNSAGLPTNQYHYEERAKQHLCGGCQSAGQWPDKLLCACKHWETVPVENDAHISTSPELTVAKEAEKGIQKQCWASHKSISLWREGQAAKYPTHPPTLFPTPWTEDSSREAEAKWRELECCQGHLPQLYRIFFKFNQFLLSLDSVLYYFYIPVPS